MQERSFVTEINICFIYSNNPVKFLEYIPDYFRIKGVPGWIIGRAYNYQFKIVYFLKLIRNITT